ncbi:acyl-CoA dehydrogenase family protein [Mycobacterium vicinigordonae]|uniref:Acyl-CoA dehydrogenase family protein n=1 Tax=Mycobacterium vicinigordonae TaxID=1719132 RepID=A0A7D6E5Y0_9MYCO|nr:acyl-CoA dehydrogenase family protein [Mycobacterium vicinigordonae]QLL07583.1 acyl-CoA dehydrogenase family protein [Mycobacterium vicinigordonae]
MSPIRSIYSDDHEVFRDSAARFINAEVAPWLTDWHRDNSLQRTVFAAAGAHGFLGVAVPERFGGGDAEDYGFLAVLLEETVNAGATGLALLWALHSGVVIPFLLEHTPATDQRRWAPGLASGEVIGIPTAGFRTASLPGGQLADLLVLSTNDVVTLVPASYPGVRIAPFGPTVMGKDASAANVDMELADLTGCSRITAAADALHRDIDLWLAVIALASARRALELALDYVGSRRIFGRPLAEFENTQFRLAELTAEQITAASYVDHCLIARAARTLTPQEAATARHVAVEVSDRTADQSLQLHGGYGYMREYPISQTFADARFIRVVGQLYSDPRRVLAAELFGNTDEPRTAS